MHVQGHITEGTNKADVLIPKETDKSENKSPTSKLTKGDTNTRGTYDREGNENKSRARTIVDYLDDYENLCGPCTRA